MLLEFAAVTLLANAHSGNLLSGTPSRIAAHPGSAIKPFVLMAFLNAGVLPVKPDYFCPGKLILNGRNFTCSHPKLNAPLDARTALAYSCNNFFAHYAAILPHGVLAQTLAKYGFPDASPLLTEALGEGRLMVTPSALLEGYLHLAKEQNPAVVAGLRDAVIYGTGQLAAVSGLQVAGKTGTAAPSYAWFAGFAPATHPEYVFAVLTRQASGGTGAAPLARDALLHQLGRANDLAILSAAGLKTLPLEEYVLGVLGGEAAELRSPEAVKAIAVAARTFAVKLRGRHKEDGYEFCGTTHCQSFRPGRVTPILRAASADTAGELLWRQGALAETFYSQDCSNQWSATLTAGQIRQDLLKSGLHVPDLLAPRVLDRDSQGRVLRLDLGDGVPLSASSFRFAIGRSSGWNQIRSDYYQIEGLTFHGRGAGNGAGICERDADRMTGNYRQILAAFYPGTRVGLTAQGIPWQVLSGERIELWSTNIQLDRVLIAKAERELNVAEQTTGWKTDLHPRLQIFPTVASFRDSTGEAGWIAASTKGRIVRLQPASRSALVLRHEMLHVLLEERANRDLPIWFREGVPLALAGGTPPTDPAYLFYRRKVEAAIGKYGKQAVLSWATRGIPSKAAE